MPTNTRQRPHSKMSVAKYVKNVGKSLALAGIDVTMENAPAMKEFLQSNDDYIKKGFAYIKNPRAMTDKADRQSTLSRVYQSVGTGLKNFKDDILSGNIYNDAKAQQAADEAFGREMGFDDFNTDDDFNFSEDGGSKTSPSGTSAVADSFGVAIGAAATSHATAVAHGTELVIGANKASTKLVIANMDKLGININAGLASVYTNISVTNKSIQTHVENSNKFYEATNNLLREQVALMRELVDMQKRIYAPQDKKGGSSSLRNAMDAHGNINLEGYIKNIQKNMNNSFGNILGIDFGSKSNPDDIFNPINLILNQLLHPSKEITKMFMRAITPKDFKDSVRSMDQALSSLFSQLIAAINKEKFKGGPLGTLATIFGIGVDTKTNIKTSEYKKDAIPFDGITKQAIIETIPGYLARIEAALTSSGNARYYDYEQGRWTDHDTIAKEYKDARKRAVTSANFGIYSDTVGLVNKTTSSNAAAGAKLQRQIEGMMNRIYADGGYFRLNKINGMPAWQYYQFDSEKTFKAVAKNLSKETIRSLARKNMQSREDFSNRMRGKEGASAIERQLFNNAHGSVDMSISGGSAKSGLIKGTGLLSLSYDEQGKNVFYYLREILNKMDHRPAANARGGASGRQSRKRSKKTKSAASSASGSSDGDPDPEPPSEDDDDGLGDTIEQISKEMAEEAEKANRMNKVSKWFQDTLDKSPIGKFVSKFGTSFGKILASPINYITKMLDKADKSLFKIMFGGSELKDADGKPINSVFDHIIKKVNESFDKIKESIGIFFKDTIGDKLKDFFKPVWDKFGAPVWNEVKTTVGTGYNRAKESVNRTIIDPIKGAVDYTKKYSAAGEFSKEAAAATGEKAREIRTAVASRSMNKDQWKKYDSAIRKHRQDQAVENRTMAKDQWKKYYGAMRKAKSGQVASADEVEGTATPADTMDPGVIASNALGTRYVTKRGLTMISPGEMIIPASTNSKELNKMLAMEKRDRNRILKASRRAGNISLNAKGTIDIEKLKESLFNIYEENKSGVVKTAAGGVLGAGAGLLTGINPLLGAMAGAGISILNNSQTLQKIVFGEDTKDGHVGGIIPKKIQDYFKKAGGDAIDFGVAGGVLGLVTGMGPLAGAAVGAGIGFLKNSETVNNFLFGEDGLIGKDGKEKISKFIKKATPNALIGAGIGILTGPFGLLGNAALGAGLGLITSTNTFHELMFGKEDDPDDKGIFGAFKEGLLKPVTEKINIILDDFKNYAKETIVGNLKKFFDPFQQMIKNAITNVGDGIKDYLNNMFERTIGIPVADWMREKLFKPLSKVVGGMIKLPYNLTKTAVSIPLKAIGNLGDHIRTRQIQKGTAYNMTAEERLQWRKDHNIILPFGRDKMQDQDERLAGMDEKDIADLAYLTRTQLKDREELGRELGEARKASGKTISKFFNTTNNADGKTLYEAVGIRKIEKLTKLAASGDMAGFNKFIKKLSDEGKISDEQMSSLNKLVSSNITTIKASIDSISGYDEDSTVVNEKLSKLLGRKVNGKKDLRQIMRAADVELKNRSRSDIENYDPEEEQAKKEEELAKMAEDDRNATEIHRKSIIERIDEIIENLSIISTSTQLIVKPDEKPIIPEHEEDVEGDKKIDVKALVEKTTKEKKSKVKKAIDKARSGDVASADEVEGNTTPEYVEDSGQIELNAFGRKRAKKRGLTMISPGEIITSEKHDEDSIEATEAEEKEKKNREVFENIEKNTKESASHGFSLKNLLFGKDKKEGKEKKGILGKIAGGISSGLGGILNFFGLKGSTLAKIGLGVVGAGAGFGLFNGLSDWFKASCWPVIKKAMFGTTNDSGKYEGGFLSGLANKFKDVMYGDGTPGNPGLATKIRTFLLGDDSTGEPGLIGRIRTGANNILFGEGGNWDNPTGGIVGWFANGGLYKLLGEKIIPGMIDGFGLIANHVIAPLTAAIIKNFPTMLTQLGGAILSGIKAALFNKKITRDDYNEVTVDNTVFKKVKDENTSSITRNTTLPSSVVSKYSSGGSSSAYTSGGSNIDVGSMLDSNYIAPENTYDSEGNHLNKSSTEIMYKKAPGIAGLLGAKELTNDMVYNSEGDIALRHYYRNNTTDSLASNVYNATKRSFIHGALGRGQNGIINTMKNVSTKGKVKGIFSLGKKTASVATKGTGLVTGAANTGGQKLNTFIQNQQSLNNYADEIIKNSGLSGKDAKKMKSEIISNIKHNPDGITDVMDILPKNLSNEAEEAILAKGTDLTNTLQNAATAGNKPSKISTFISNSENKFANSKIGQKLNGIKTSFNNSKLGSRLNRKNSVNEFAQAAAEANGLTGRKADKYAKKLTKKVKWNGSSAIDAALDGIDDSKMSKEASESLINKAISATDNVTKAPTLSSKAKNLMTNTTDALKNTNVGQKVTTAVDKVKDVAKNNKVTQTVGKAVDTGKGLIEKITSKLKGFFAEIADNATIMKYFKKAAKSDVTESALKKTIKELGEKIAKSALGKAAGKALTKIASAAAKFVPFLNIALYVSDFLWGYNNADTLLGVAKGDEYKVGIGQKCICGLVHLVNNNFLLGLIPTDTIIDVFVDVLFPLFGLNMESLKEARERADNVLDEWNKAHPEETYTNLEDFNNKDKWTTKAKKAISKGWDKVKTGVGKAVSSAGKKAKKAISKGWDKVKTGVSGAVDKVKNSKVGKAVSSAGKKVKDKVKSGLNKVKTGAGKLWNKITGKDKKKNKENTEDEENESVVSISNDKESSGGFFSKIKSGISNIAKKITSSIKSKNKDKAEEKILSDVKSGKFDILDKRYWSFTKKPTGSDSDVIDDITNATEYTSKLLNAPEAMFGGEVNKIQNNLTKSFNSSDIKNISNQTDKSISNAKSGKISVLSNDFWKINTNNIGSDNILVSMAKTADYVRKVFEAPIIMMEQELDKAAEGSNSYREKLNKAFGGENTALGRSGKRRKRLFGKGKENPLNMGSEHLYQSSETIANIKYGNSTIGEAGCAPVAATNLINNINRTNSSVSTNLMDAANYAEKHGYVNEDGTDIRYFNSYLSSKGIATKNTSDRNEALKAIRSGKQVVMLGQDNYNNNAPFGTNPHFITATGMDSNGNIIVEDPDLPDTRIAYSPYKLMKSVKSSIITSNNKKKSGSHRYNGSKYVIGGKSKAARGMRHARSGKGKGLGAQAVLNVARSQIGVKEQPGYPNVVKYNNAYWSEFDKQNLGTRTDYCTTQDNYQWCCVFVWWVFNQAGAAKLFMNGGHSAYCPTCAGYYSKLGKFNKSDPKPGDIIMLNWDDNNGQPEHAGIVESVEGNIIHTIEGNADDCVSRKKRHINNVVGFCHIDYPYDYDSTNVINMGKYGDYSDYKSIAINGGSMTADNISSFIGDQPAVVENITGYFNENSSNTNGDTIFTKISNLASSVFKAKYGENAFKMVFGDNASSNTTDNANTDETIGTGAALTGSSNSEKIWNYLRAHGYSAAGTAGLMGNLEAESSLRPNNLEDFREKTLGCTDDTYTEAINKKTYSKDTFMKDLAGYGLAQWTIADRKQDLYENTIEKGIGIGDLGGQLAFLTDEMSRKYPSIDTLLRNSTSVNEASDTVLTDFENPYHKNFTERRSLSQAWYKKYKTAAINENMSYTTNKINNDSSNSNVPQESTSDDTSTTTVSTSVPTLAPVAPSADPSTAPGVPASIPGSSRGRGRKRVGDARTISRSGGYRTGGGTATNALNARSIYSDSGRVVSTNNNTYATSNSKGVDYATFLNTIITVLMQIADNTTLLNSILEILSKNFNLNINKDDITKAANSRVRAQEALNRAVQESGGASNMSSMINNRDTQYILQALQAIARE